VFFIPNTLGFITPETFSAFRVSLNSGDFNHIGIHNFRIDDGLVRNAGMFWEPGAFAGYLILAIFFLVRDGHIDVLKTKQGAILILALLSTQSTTGYMAFLVLSIFIAYRSGLFRKIISKIIIFPAMLATLLFGAYIAGSEISFVGEKISDQIESASNQDDVSRINRFGNFTYDLKWIGDKPLFGWSANPETRFSFDPDLAELINGQGNGLTGFAVKFGLLGFCLFIGFFAYNTLYITGQSSAAIFGVAVISVLLYGEQFLGFPIFLSLMFMPKVITRKNQIVRGN
jgi:hypothetical protein